MHPEKKRGIKRVPFAGTIIFALALTACGAPAVNGTDQEPARAVSIASPPSQVMSRKDHTVELATDIINGKSYGDKQSHPGLVYPNDLRYNH